MVNPVARHLRRWCAPFARNEGGAATVSFVLMLPVLFGTMLLTLDSGFATMRAALLDRAVDISARSIRNGTITAPTLANIKTDMCSRLTFFPDCSTQLRVQIIAVPRNTYAMPATTLACTDQGAAIAPVRGFVAGQANPLAVLRACMEITTFTPSALMSNRPFTYSIHAETLLAGSAT